MSRTPHLMGCARRICGGVPHCTIRASRGTAIRSVTSSLSSRSHCNLEAAGSRKSELRADKQSPRDTRELYAVNVLNKLDLAAEAVDNLGDSAEDLMAMMSESVHNLALVDLSAVMDEP